MTTVVLAVIAAGVARVSGTLVAFLGIFGWGLFASTIVPALAIGLNWHGATRAGAIASIVTGLVRHAGRRDARLLQDHTRCPAGVAVSALSLVTSLLVFFIVTWLTRKNASEIDADMKLVMET